MTAHVGWDPIERMDYGTADYPLLMGDQMLVTHDNHALEAELWSMVNIRDQLAYYQDPHYTQEMVLQPHERAMLPSLPILVDTEERPVVATETVTLPPPPPAPAAKKASAKRTASTALKESKALVPPDDVPQKVDKRPGRARPVGLRPTSSRRRNTHAETPPPPLNNNGGGAQLQRTASYVRGPTKRPKKATARTLDKRREDLADLVMGTDEALLTWLGHLTTPEGVDRVFSFLVTSQPIERRPFYLMHRSALAALYFHFVERVRLFMSGHHNVESFERQLYLSQITCLDPNPNILAEIEVITRANLPSCESNTLLVARYSEWLPTRLQAFATIQGCLQDSSYRDAETMLTTLPVSLCDNLIKCIFTFHAAMRAVEFICELSKSQIPEFRQIASRTPMYLMGVYIFGRMMDLLLSYIPVSERFVMDKQKGCPLFKSCTSYLASFAKLEVFRQAAWLLTVNFTNGAAELAKRKLRAKAVFRHGMYQCLLQKTVTELSLERMDQLEDQLDQIPSIKESDFCPGNEFHELLPHDTSYLTRELLESLTTRREGETDAHLEARRESIIPVVSHCAEHAIIFLNTITRFSELRLSGPTRQLELAPVKGDTTAIMPDLSSDEEEDPFMEDE